ncbi:hypothetical protein QBC36DRAFT_362603 [Triangularia setosa]|uniref:Uncharacterized protein n=1 Tax=Triangularia setosa TaxID=2587417 RepID=A0AAN6VZ74_9PEZI|nr:hypothetical protein QBC36DRAFT_362603 [Podospora setosa]
MATCLHICMSAWTAEKSRMCRRMVTGGLPTVVIGEKFLWCLNDTGFPIGQSIQNCFEIDGLSAQRQALSPFCSRVSRSILSPDSLAAWPAAPRPPRVFPHLASASSGRVLRERVYQIGPSAAGHEIRQWLWHSRSLPRGLRGNLPITLGGDQTAGRRSIGILRWKILSRSPRAFPRVRALTLLCFAAWGQHDECRAVLVAQRQRPRTTHDKGTAQSRGQPRTGFCSVRISSDTPKSFRSRISISYSILSIMARPDTLNHRPIGLTTRSNSQLGTKESSVIGI